MIIPDVTPEFLTNLSKDKKIFNRIRAAEHMKTPPEVLASLAWDRSKSVRQQVANNPHTPPNALASLSEDRNSIVRRFVALNENTAPSTLARLVLDKNKHVLKIIAGNINTPPDALTHLATDKDKWIRQTVADHVQAPPEVLSFLAEDKAAIVRRVVFKHPNTPPAAYKRILEREPMLEMQKSERQYFTIASRTTEKLVIEISTKQKAERNIVTILSVTLGLLLLFGILIFLSMDDSLPPIVRAIMFFLSASDVVGMIICIGSILVSKKEPHLRAIILDAQTGTLTKIFFRPYSEKEEMHNEFLPSLNTIFAIREKHVSTPSLDPGGISGDIQFWALYAFLEDGQRIEIWNNTSLAPICELVITIKHFIANLLRSIHHGTRPKP